MCEIRYGTWTKRLFKPNINYIVHKYISICNFTCYKNLLHLYKRRIKSFNFKKMEGNHHPPIFLKI